MINISISVADQPNPVEAAAHRYICIISHVFFMLMYFLIHAQKSMLLKLIFVNKRVPPGPIHSGLYRICTRYLLFHIYLCITRACCWYNYLFPIVNEWTKFHRMAPDSCSIWRSSASRCMGLLPDTKNCGLRMRRECRNRFPLPPTLMETISLRSRHACRDR